MKCTIPEISWHNRDPVLSLDIQLNKGNDVFYRLATGGTDSHVLIWLLSVEKGGAASLECAADLTRHTKPVNCVRFSPSGDILASGDDEACIILWKMKTSSDPPELFNGEEESFKEQWTSVKVLRGHLQDVYDLSWSSDSKHLISGSVDNTAIMWEVPSGKNLGILTEHKGFVQGVAWDPCGQYVATMSSDRVCRVYNAASRKVVSKMYKGHLPGRQQEPESKPAHYFHDDTLKSFFRRLTFTPDGQLLIVPSGLVEEPDKKPTNSTIVFHRNCLQKPILYLPSLNQYSVAIRCCPVYFTLRQMDSPPLFQLPYRVVIAVATQSNVVLYDTQHAAPFAFITNIHYTRLTDLSWSSDGRVLVVSSTDGYCSVITFAENELGTVYTGENAQQSNRTPEQTKEPVDNQSKSPKQKSNVAISLSEDANMSFEESENKQDDLKTRSMSRENKETPMSVDDFSLAYEGTVGEPVLESKSTGLTAELANMCFEESGKKNCDGAVEGSPVSVSNLPSEKTENKQDDLKTRSMSHENKETPKSVDDFSLTYEGTVGEPVLESKSTGLTAELANMSFEESGTKNCDGTVEGSPVSAKDSRSEMKEDIKNCNESLKNAIAEHNSENKVLENSSTLIEAKKESPKKTSEPTKSMQEEALTSPKSGVNVTPGSNNKKTPRRVQLITLSSPKSKKKLLE